VLAETLQCATRIGDVSMDEEVYRRKGFAAHVVITGDIEGRIIFDIDQQTAARFDPTVFKDDTRARIQAAIQKKVDEGTEISVTEQPPEGEGKVIDLMEALRASLQRSETARPQVGRLGPRKEPKRVEEAARPSRRRAGKRNA